MQVATVAQRRVFVVLFMFSPCGTASITQILRPENEAMKADFGHLRFSDLREVQDNFNGNPHAFLQFAVFF